MIKETILTRKSRRSFNKKKLSKKIIEDVIDIAKFAPSGKNRQPWRVKILAAKEKKNIIDILNLKENELLQKGSLPISINAISQSCYTLLIFNPYSYIEKEYSHNKMLMDTQSIGAFIQNLLLVLTERGLGSLWINDVYYAKNEIESCYDGQNIELIATIAIGYSDEIRSFNLRNSLEDILF